MRILRSFLALAALGLAAGPLGAQQSLTGAGATFPAPIYQKWFAEYARAHNVRVNYQAIGSGGGIRQYTEGTVDFGASDGPMTDTMIAAVGGNVVHIPTVLGAVVITYNLPSLGATKLRLDGATIADIFQGRITRWNDPRIAALNPGVALPAMDMVVVHRSDGSGTTYVFTDFLSKVSPDWKSSVGNAVSVNWPTGLGGKGNEGVTQQVRQLEGSVGYVELVYAISNRLPYALVKNAAGQYVEPTLESVSAAAAGARLAPTTDFRVSITNAAGRTSYPISSFTWLLIRKDNPDAAKARAIRDFLNWMISPAAQEMTKPLAYAPLPQPVVELVRARLRTLTANGQPIR
ncbi:MAG TPA: phosphate ABC transporter substrate-binding protein PstS [Gemmatimonadales bacterium]|jgi:phosphate transport system substrate-binding protein|nr:phosphate ABC transporter substrate-binding protein PstS [Gemmatimonadales bacterium]